MRFVATMLLPVVLALTTTVGWGQESFRVSWQPRPGALPPSIEGRVHNDSPFRVTDVRLHVQGLDARRQIVGARLTWAYGDIVPGGETSYAVETIPGAVDYRVTVVSYDVVSDSRIAPEPADDIYQ